MYILRIQSAIAAGLILFLSIPAFAGDGWSGIYAGVNGGLEWNRSAWRYFQNDGSAALGGGQLGYNYQMGSFLLGIEGDADASGIDSKHQCAGRADSRCYTKQNFLASARLRFGFIPIDQILLYTDGGLAFANYKAGEHYPLAQRWDINERTGGTVGLGGEYAFASKWSTGLEWNFYDFGKSTSSGGIDPATVPFKEYSNTLVARISYHF